jgi:hypothetical protein
LEKEFDREAKFVAFVLLEKLTIFMMGIFSIFERMAGRRTGIW